MNQENSLLLLNDVAELARVPKSARASFIRTIARAIDRAQKDSARPRRAGKNSAGALTRTFFNPIARAATDLRIALRRLDEQSADDVPGSVAAAHYFGEALMRLAPQDDEVNPVADLIRLLDLEMVAAVAARASELVRQGHSKAGRKKGTGSPAFDIFVMLLLAACEQSGGKLTIYKTAYKEPGWDGSLFAAIERMRPLLPTAQFFPRSRLSASLQTVYQRWRTETGKTRRKKPQIARSKS